MRIRYFIFGASVIVAALCFGGAYWSLDRVFADAMRANAARASEAATRLAFASMYETMSQGWRRSQTDAFLQAIADASKDSGISVQIYRGPAVEQTYGTIRQPPLDAELEQVLASGEPFRLDASDHARHIYPLLAEKRCLVCHETAIGAVLGAVEVHQEYAGLLAGAQRSLMLALAAILSLALLPVLGAAWWVSRRIERSVLALQTDFDRVNAVGDLRSIALAEHDLGFVELNQVLTALGSLLEKLRSIAVDKDVLTFEIGMLEKFVITSEVVRDWSEYVSRLLVDINGVLPTHMLFSIFRIDDELLDLEIFWRGPPTAQTKALVEKYIHQELTELRDFSEFRTCNVHHHVALANEQEIELSGEAIAVRVKSFFVDTPKIGGIVGIGVHAATIEDETLHLVMESVLSTLLNVIGSVKAIYKHTRDLEYYATRDPLTDLFNQRMFWEMCTNEIDRAQRHGQHFGLLLLDFDNFKLINDNCGHTAGDLYLQQLSQQIQMALRGGDILARYGGDEFVALLPGANLDVTVMVAERVRQSIADLELTTQNGVRIRGTASIGVAVFPEHANNAKDLVLFADSMMYRAKNVGKAQVAVPTREDIIDIFRDISQKSVMVLEAIEARRVVPFFQPILDVASKRVVACEVLSRLELGEEIIGADQFVEIAERIGVIHRLDMLVVEQALQALNSQRHEGEIFINLSPRALVFSEFAVDLRRIINASGIAPNRVVFEITERDTVKNIGLLERFLIGLKNDGFKLAIDDFGSGFSSFHYLRRFPIDYLKIEGDFIANMLRNDKDHTFVISIRSLAREMGIAVVAEFVETAEILEELERLEIHRAQGYYIGRPARQLPPVDWRPAA
ncbi:MAG: bifunctional diguanylate cyclase/phosphodiesterase [Betaproteobacteria bacterium]|nr:bifunctional diguanylate cyclase/phosphodiesterase [Betaproteobacteria bacterium]MCL2886361.1 bifunctional diguanylate cyclase/phosphodiesterase [Betaproteobacteria bacterium]